jgi:hypothetical protein
LVGPDLERIPAFLDRLFFGCGVALLERGDQGGIDDLS